MSDDGTRGATRPDRPVLRAVAAAAAGAIGWGALIVVTRGVAFYLPVVLVVGLVENGVVGLVLVPVLVPLAVAVFVRRPWWVRWVAVGVVAVSVGVVAVPYLWGGPFA